ncbi:hypothetical protein BgiBS90_029985, partial [Biomphalaria glabrata]
AETVMSPRKPFNPGSLGRIEEDEKSGRFSGSGRKTVDHEEEELTLEEKLRKMAELRGMRMLE